jgi:hypothetical protein
MLIEILDPDIAMLDRLPPEPITPRPRYLLIDFCWQAAVTLAPDEPEWRERIGKLADAAWKLKRADGEPRMQ